MGKRGELSVPVSLNRENPKHLPGLPHPHTMLLSSKEAGQPTDGTDDR